MLLFWYLPLWASRAISCARDTESLGPVVDGAEGSDKSSSRFFISARFVRRTAFTASTTSRCLLVLDPMYSGPPNKGSAEKGVARDGSLSDLRCLDDMSRWRKKRPAKREAGTVDLHELDKILWKYCIQGVQVLRGGAPHMLGSLYKTEWNLVGTHSDSEIKLISSRNLGRRKSDHNVVCHWHLASFSKPSSR